MNIIVMLMNILVCIPSGCQSGLMLKASRREHPGIEVYLPRQKENKQGDEFWG